MPPLQSPYPASLSFDGVKVLEKTSCCRSSGVEHSLGKGEVGSSNLPGSTIFSPFPERSNKPIKNLKKSQLSKKLLNFFDRLGCFSFLSALASI